MSQNDPFKGANMNDQMGFSQPMDAGNPFGNISFMNSQTEQGQTEQMNQEMPVAPQTNMIQTQGNVQLPPIGGSEMNNVFTNGIEAQQMFQNQNGFQQPVQNQNGFQQPNQQHPQNLPPQNNQFYQQPQQQFNAFNQFQQQNSNLRNNFEYSNNGMNHNNQQRKYNIIDIAWFVNYKVYQNALDESECAYAIISYNADYNNLRIGLKGLNNSVPFDPNYITPNNWYNRVLINLYPENCAQIRYSGETSIAIVERMFNLNSNWTPNKSIININQDSCVLQSMDINNNSHSFTFINYQYKLLLNCFDFMLNGSAWSLHCKMRQN